MHKALKTNKKNFYYNKETLVMGILNVTPDSFSDGGSYLELENAISQGLKMEAEGAHIIDVGGESTRPGHIKISEKEEIARITPIISALSNKLTIPISIDTYKSNVAQAALEAGASIINDVWGAKYDPRIAEVAAHFNAPIILMHNRSNQDYIDLIPDMLEDLKESIRIAKEKGVSDEQIILDPGVGFAKSYEGNLEVIRNLEHFSTLGYPVLLGTSRKSFIGHAVDLPVTQRDEATGATSCYGVSKGVNIVRVHNVEMNVRLVRMMDIILGKGGHENG
ncbi:dihydropteroate synthase [Saliterribacillus persicus]|uniref:Dihydropteroate synthase n=1 Tax=Saliterribacillus persicus TaxID=930114 RepID=A0A368X5D1_9BACI|nr:dihydropteroate synthase [Saliterribacillus persicus]RCW63025.1 dihydropteroate synthase [Saliterribacillus persicus]